jgi:hypothetical protein
MNPSDLNGRFRTHRAHNEDLARVARFRPHPVSFLCECGAPSCEERVHLLVIDYERITALPGGYVLADGHHEAWRTTRTG